MKNHLYGLVVCLVFSLGLTVAYANETDNKVQTLDSKNKQLNDDKVPILLKASQKTVTLRLESNPTTGFSWFLVGYDAHFIKPLQRHFVIREPKLIGSGGVEEWHFALLPAATSVPSVIKIRMMYARPFSLQTGQVRQYTLVVMPN